MKKNLHRAKIYIKILILESQFKTKDRVLVALGQVKFVVNANLIHIVHKSVNQNMSR